MKSRVNRHPTQRLRVKSYEPTVQVPHLSSFHYGLAWDLPTGDPGSSGVILFIVVSYMTCHDLSYSLRYYLRA